MLKITEKITFNNATATEYDRGIRRTLPTYDTLFRLVQAHFRKQLAENSELLIIGAGGGTELALLGPENPNWTFTAVDPSADMLDLARYKAKKCQIENQIHFIEGTLEEISQPSFYDAATLILVLHFIPNDEEKRTLLKQVHSHLKRGAPFVIATMFGNIESEVFNELINIWKAYWLDTTNLTEEKVNEMEKTIRNLSIMTEEKLQAMLKEAGFTRITKFFQTNMFGGWVCCAT